VTTYEVSWTGLDAGREGLWKPETLLGVLRLIDAHAGERVYDADSRIYAELENLYPDELWRADDNGRFRPLFRDYPHPWTRTGLASFDTTFSATALGKALLADTISLRDVYLRTMHSFTADAEKPFAIIAAAFLSSSLPLTLDDLIFGVMREFRPGVDDFAAAMARADRSEPAPDTTNRRLRHLMKLMTDAGLVAERSTRTWSIQDADALRSLASNLSTAGVPRLPEPTTDSPSIVDQDTVDTPTARGRGIGRLSAPERRAVELRSMQVTTEFYQTGGWTVTDVAASRPYDLLCQRGAVTLHVEVKGTTTASFRQIELTRNEVDHCRGTANMELALVSGIRLEQDDEGHFVGTGGVLEFLIPWTIDDARLTPISFSYELPPRG